MVLAQGRGAMRHRSLQRSTHAGRRMCTLHLSGRLLGSMGHGYPWVAQHSPLRLPSSPPPCSPPGRPSNVVVVWRESERVPPWRHLQEVPRMSLRGRRSERGKRLGLWTAGRLAGGKGGGCGSHGRRAHAAGGGAEFVRTARGAARCAARARALGRSHSEMDRNDEGPRCDANRDRDPRSRAPHHGQAPRRQEAARRRGGQGREARQPRCGLAMRRGAGDFTDVFYRSPHRGCVHDTCSWCCRLTPLGHIQPCWLQPVRIPGVPPTTTSTLYRGRYCDDRAPTEATSGPNRPKVRPNRQKSADCWPNSAQIGQVVAHSGQFVPNLCRCWAPGVNLPMTCGPFSQQLLDNFSARRDRGGQLAGMRVEQLFGRFRATSLCHE